MTLSAPSLSARTKCGQVDTIGQNVLEAVDLVLCLDSIGGSGGQRLEAAAGQGPAGLTLHVSKADGANKPPHQLWGELSAVAGEVRPGVTVAAGNTARLVGPAQRSEHQWSATPSIATESPYHLCGTNAR